VPWVLGSWLSSLPPHGPELLSLDNNSGLPSRSADAAELSRSGCLELAMPACNFCCK
jgi:hypothetical protein